MDSRCAASPTGPNDYGYCTGAGMSSTVPWVAGLYVLACQVKPPVTREKFRAAAFSTAITNNLGFGLIINPAGLIDALKAGP